MKYQIKYITAGYWTGSTLFNIFICSILYLWAISVARGNMLIKNQNIADVFIANFNTTFEGIRYNMLLYRHLYETDHSMDINHLVDFKYYQYRNFTDGFILTTDSEAISNFPIKLDFIKDINLTTQPLVQRILNANTSINNPLLGGVDGVFKENLGYNIAFQCQRMNMSKLFICAVVNTLAFYEYNLPYELVETKDVYFRSGNNPTSFPLYDKFIHLEKSTYREMDQTRLVELFGYLKFNITIAFSDEYYDQNLRIIGIIIFLVIIFCIILIVQLTCFLQILYMSKKKEADMNLLYKLDADKESEINRRSKETAYQMLHYVNHELRNPLNIINGMLDLSRMDLDDLFEVLTEMKSIKSKHIKNKKILTILDKLPDLEPLLSNIDTAHNNCMLMHHIINDILDIRKIEEGKLELSISTIKLREFIKSVVKGFSTKIQEKPSVEFEYDILTIDDSFEFESDRHRLSQLLMNFLSNAYKFTHNGSIKLVVLIKSDKLTFKVIDTGTGIPLERQSNIFKPFEQEYASAGSSGLGLYLCSLIIKNLKGEIGFESDNNGSTFWFRIHLDTKLNKYVNIAEENV